VLSGRALGDGLITRPEGATECGVSECDCEASMWRLWPAQQVLGFILSIGHKALRESRGIALLCFQTSALEGVRGQRHAPAGLYPREHPVPIGQEAGWAPGPVWTGVENLAPPGFDPRTVQPVANRYTD
jgi:hypothetical protein